MLPGFIRLADYMVVEGLMLLAVGTGDPLPSTIHQLLLSSGEWANS